MSEASGPCSGLSGFALRGDGRPWPAGSQPVSLKNTARPVTGSFGRTIPFTTFDAGLRRGATCSSAYWIDKRQGLATGSQPPEETPACSTYSGTITACRSPGTPKFPRPSGSRAHPTRHAARRYSGLSEPRVPAEFGPLDRHDPANRISHGRKLPIEAHGYATSRSTTMGDDQNLQAGDRSKRIKGRPVRTTTTRRH